EDDRFFEHPGVDYHGILRAVYSLATTGKKAQGGSTITMQVTRNFLLTPEKTYIRKIKEIILALKIEQQYSKEKILELYLNKIYLGHRSYGVIAAANTYYGKKLTELSLAQLAMIAGLPKAPSSFNPLTNPKRAHQRRDYVLDRMVKLNHITQAEFDQAIKEPLSAARHTVHLDAPAPYIAEMVRNEMVRRYDDKAYTMGLKVYTTLQSQLQQTASQALKSAIHNYDQRHGYRSLPHLNQAQFTSSDYIKVGDIQSAHIIAVNDQFAIAQLKDKTRIELPFKNIQWARTFKSRSYLGAKLKSIHDILKTNDLVIVRQLVDNTWALAQKPDAEAAFVALNAYNGAIIALSGGFDFYYSKYNRVTQSKRQPGSGFKPIIYTTALEKGFTAASVINDAPIVIDDPSQESAWRPENYSKKFFGLTPLRTALRKSRNIISIRLLRELGINTVVQTALRFGFNKEQVPQSLSLALGSGYANPLQMARVYSVFANGGFLIKPYFIERIENHQGELLFQATQKIACQPCDLPNQAAAPRIISPQVSFLMNTLLRDVVQRGTATRAKVLGRTDLAGKTGTTNDQKDAWFNGFSSGIAASAWFGLDSAKTLGRYETGGKAALPIWIDFMREALKNRPEQPLEKPEGISQAYVDPKTGLLAPAGTLGHWEYFRNEYRPTQFSSIEIEPSGEESDMEESLF
ncbi:MAG: PBP1A family penicillin-binding protein, partial [Methylococcales bacterium]|nr:PBP1A family penicillin-binding protein [Methylococcales bacterium]